MPAHITLAVIYSKPPKDCEVSTLNIKRNNTLSFQSSTVSYKIKKVQHFLYQKIKKLLF